LPFKRFLGGVLRRVLSPPQIKKAIASSDFVLLAMTWKKSFIAPFDTTSKK